MKLRMMIVLALFALVCIVAVRWTVEHRFADVYTFVNLPRPTSHPHEAFIRPDTPRIAHVVYLNLDARVDRRAETEVQLRAMGWSPVRIPAVAYTPGAYGCTLSHIRALEYAQTQKWPHVLVCEDDVQLDRPPDAIHAQLDTFFRAFPQWDVVMLGGMPTVWHTRSQGPTCLRIRAATLSHCYLIRAAYYPVLLQNLRGGLHRRPLDLFWYSLQRRDTWLMPVPVIAVQRQSYSDLQHTVVQHDDASRTRVKWLARLR
jgi:hypothetical protein